MSLWPLLGEAFLLIGFVLLVPAGPSGACSSAMPPLALSTSPWHDVTLAFLILGFGLKIGLVPLHVWMPLAYTAAPIAAAAALSGAAVKAGVIIHPLCAVRPATAGLGQRARRRRIVLGILRRG